MRLVGVVMRWWRGCEGMQLICKSNKLDLKMSINKNKIMLNTIQEKERNQVGP
jgi:hypothetical protein